MRGLSATRAVPNTRKYNLNIIIRYADFYAIQFIKIRPNKNYKNIQLIYVKKISTYTRFFILLDKRFTMRRVEHVLNCVFL